MYLGTVVINIIISFIQYQVDRNQAQRAIFLFWIWTIISFVANGWLPENDMRIIVVASLGTFFSNYFLGSFFARLHDLEIPRKSLFIVYCILIFSSYLLSLTGVSFTLYAYPGIIACSFPLFYTFYLVTIKKKSPLTTVQKIFVVICFIYAIHLLDWPYFKPRPDLIVIGFWIAFILMHTLSILTPFMGNENLLQRRNARLSEEVKEKARLLTTAELKIWEGNKLASIGRMAGGVAHEINNPLQIISLQADELICLSESGSVSAEHVVAGSDKILQMVNRISNITESLRKVARDRRTVDSQKNDLGQIAEDTLSLCFNRMTALGINFISQIPEPPLPINCNAIEISQVLLNLMNNAIDAVETLDDRQIKLTIQKIRSIYRITIEDSGSIDPEIASRMMEPFFTTKPVGKGIGLGLSVAKSIVENHNGQLYLDTKSKRTRFVLELPF
ncbi:MAG: hypothetical protein A2622_13550 [Bdellovibrionales bacterium RIFCSPHIGHO2_01_FULL_40_29]|nr:MAG: hypothetical protein A2622_13550 [Bdellovibrionales bacterium RIFCSPHIGHO2_01_FULL_40_29]OFZ34279.1 MAG: hypothetical protein A3D17_04400 [Bdellovibrionales bacterium RIFCSPHIGHO2_02_FULL_40_15]